MYLTQTSYKQLIYNYTVKQNVSNSSYDNTKYNGVIDAKVKCNSFSGWCYPSCRPLKIYRKQGSQFNASKTLNSTQPCICDNSKQVGLPIKMLGKSCCTDTKGPVGSKTGNIMSFSGNAKIRSAIQPNNKLYFSDSYSYLRSRGNTFNDKDKFRNIPQTDYTNPLNSSYYEIQESICATPIKTTYKPNNKNFSTQGAVSSDTRLLKLKYDTITKNNASFVTPFNTKLDYSQDPVFSQKNKVNKCINIMNCSNISSHTPVSQSGYFAPH